MLLRRCNFVIIVNNRHGANFVISYNGQTIRCGKRKEFLKSDDTFFYYQVIEEKYRDAVVALYEGVGLLH